MKKILFFVALLLLLGDGCVELPKQPPCVPRLVKRIEQTAWGGWGGKDSLTYTIYYQDGTVETHTNYLPDCIKMVTSVP